MSPNPKHTDLSLEIDGQTYGFEAGETVLEVARKNGIHIPTLCHDPRLKPAGACRTCLVEVEGARRLMPSCATAAESGAKVSSHSPRIERHRKSLLALYLTDHPDAQQSRERRRPNQLLQMAQDLGAPTDWPSLQNIRAGRPDDRNPYVDFDPEACIACARCTRYCDEVESVSAITLAGRAGETTISTSDGRSLLDTSCELCGGCIDTCPTGAMAEKRPITRQEKHEDELTKVRSTCNFCGVGCQLDLNVDPDARDGAGQVIKITSPEPGTTSNDGNLCVKGRFAYDFIHHADRLTHPLIRDANGQLQKATWEEAMERTAQGLLGIKQEHGADSLAFVSSSRCTVEENYLMQKISRVGIGTNNVHQCAAT